MLGRYHVWLSLLTIFPFLIPLIFVDYGNILTYAVGFIIAILIGSLIPDADCSGKPKLYYDFKIIYVLMQPIQKLTEIIFKSSHIKTRIKIEYEVKKEHRGVMHAPIGILISTFILTLILLIFLIVFKLFNIIFLLAIFFGVLIGQFLHLLEDSCTTDGINWKFPFGTKLIKGGINTWNKKDFRYKLYSFLLGAVSIVLLFGYSFNKINLSLLLLYPILFCVVIILWIIFIRISK